MSENTNTDSGYSKCRYGIYGCVTTMKLKGRIDRMQTQQENDGKDIEALWRNHDAMRGLIIKMFLTFAGLVAMLQVIIKFIPVGN